MERNREGPCAARSVHGDEQRVVLRGRGGRAGGGQAVGWEEGGRGGSADVCFRIRQPGVPPSQLVSQPVWQIGCG